MISPPAGIRVSAVRLLFQQFIICPYLVRPSGSSMLQGFQTAVIHVRLMLPPVGVARRESVDYIADTTLRFFRPCHLICAGSLRIRVVVVSQSTRVVTVPVNILCRTVIKLTSLILIRVRHPSSPAHFARKSSQRVSPDHIY